LLIWGKAKEAWASDQFSRLVGARAQKGLCVFDPEKRSIVQQIRENSSTDWDITEHYGQFTPTLLDPFFTRLRRAGAGGGGQ
jgi:hypothetical protein